MNGFLLELFASCDPSYTSYHLPKAIPPSSQHNVRNSGTQSLSYIRHNPLPFRRRLVICCSPILSSFIMYRYSLRVQTSHFTLDSSVINGTNHCILTIPGDSSTKFNAAQSEKPDYISANPILYAYHTSLQLSPRDMAKIVIRIGFWCKACKIASNKIIICIYSQLIDSTPITIYQAATESRLSQICERSYTRCRTLLRTGS